MHFDIHFVQFVDEEIQKKSTWMPVNIIIYLITVAASILCCKLDAWAVQHTVGGTVMHFV